MFSIQQKREISEAVQKILRATNHPELPKGEITFLLHVEGAESWSWADIKNNGSVVNPEANANPFNEIVAAKMLGEKVWENSSTVAKTTYNNPEKKLVVEFKNGQQYEYSEFPESAWLDMINAASIGSYVQKKLKGSYPVTQL